MDRKGLVELIADYITRVSFPVLSTVCSTRSMLALCRLFAHVLACASCLQVARLLLC